MGHYFIRRLLVAAVLILCAATLVFSLLHVVPGDPVVVLLGEYASAEQLAEVRSDLGLDQPLLTQYVDWLGGIVRGDFGTSITMRAPVADLILQRLPRTIELTVVSIVLALMIGIPAGVISALRQGKKEDVGLTFLSLITLSIPTYVSGTLLVLVFAVKLDWLPASGYVDFRDDPLDHLKVLILPSITLASHLAASIIRFTRSSVLEVLELDYVRTARSKGLAERRIIGTHVLRNSLLPVTTIVGLQAGFLLGGTLIVEVIFGWPGMGMLLFQGVNALDYPLVQTCVLVISSLFILVNLFVDILNGVIDPRVAHGRPAE